MSEQAQEVEEPKKKATSNQSQKKTEQQIIDSILGNKPKTEEVAVELPSKNLFYNLYRYL